MLAVCHQQALALVSLSQNSKDKLRSQPVNSSLVHSRMTSQSPSIYSHAYTRARTQASAPKYHHQSPGVSWSKCVLASRAQQGQVKKKKKRRNNRNSCSVFVSHSCNTAFHPFIIHIGMRKLPGSSRGSYSIQQYKMNSY